MIENVVAISIGFGMAAACGFRIFVPMVVVGAAARFDWLTLSDGFHWLGTWPAITAFGIATVLEIGAYYFPWLDNVLDSASVPAAVIAGIIVSAACVVDMDPMLKWTLAVIAGGGTAGTIKSGMAGIRLGSTATTGGLGNSLVSTLEWTASLILAGLSVFVPILAGIIAIAIVLVLIRVALRLAKRSLRLRLAKHWLRLRLAKHSLRLRCLACRAFVSTPKALYSKAQGRAHRGEAVVVRTLGCIVRGSLTPKVLNADLSRSRRTCRPIGTA